MTTQPSPEIQQRLRAMCAQLAVSRHLDRGAQRELYGRMEEKLLGCLNGGEALTEEEAFVLMREHFGDPAVVKGLLRAAHPRFMAVQGAAFATCWVAQVYLAATHATRTPIPLLLAAAALSMALGALSVWAIRYRDRFQYDSAFRTMYHRFQLLCVVPSLTVISLVSSLYRTLHMAPEAQSMVWRCMVGGLLLIYLYATLAFGWSLLRWRMSRPSEA